MSLAQRISARFGNKTDILLALTNVRFRDKADMAQTRLLETFALKALGSPAGFCQQREKIPLRSNRPKF